MENKKTEKIKNALIAEKQKIKLKQDLMPLEHNAVNVRSVKNIIHLNQRNMSILRKQEN